MLRIGWGLRIRLCMPRRLSRAWGPCPLSWRAASWALRGRRNWWSPCLVSALRRARGHSTLKRWNNRDLRALRWFLRRGWSWPSLARYWRVSMASSDARYGRNGMRGVGRLFKLLATGCPLERKLIRKVVERFSQWGIDYYSKSTIW